MSGFFCCPHLCTLLFLDDTVKEASHHFIPDCKAAPGFIAQWLEHWSCKPGVVSSILTGACARSAQFYSKHCLVHTQQGTSMEMVVNSKIVGEKNGSTYLVEEEIYSDGKSISISSHQNFIEDISKPEVHVNLSQSLLIL